MPIKGDIFTSELVPVNDEVEIEIEIEGPFPSNSSFKSISVAFKELPT